MVDINQLKFVSKPSKQKSATKRERKSSSDLRFRKSTVKGKLESKFYVGESIWKDNDLDQKGITVIASPTEVFLAVVDNENATSLKRTNKLKGEATKGKNFKSLPLETNLIEAGLLKADTNDNQFFTLEKIGENLEIEGIKIYALLSIKSTETETPIEVSEPQEYETQAPTENQEESKSLADIADNF